MNVNQVLGQQFGKRRSILVRKSLKAGFLQGNEFGFSRRSGVFLLRYGRNGPGEQENKNKKGME